MLREIQSGRAQENARGTMRERESKREAEEDLWEAISLGQTGRQTDV